MQGMPRYYGPGGLMAAAGLGQDTGVPPPPPATVVARPGGGTVVVQGQNGLYTAMWIAGTAASAALAYHGYRRNKSIGWAFVWALFGGMVWPVALPISFAQGFGKPAVKSNSRRRRSR